MFIPPIPHCCLVILYQARVVEKGGKKGEKKFYGNFYVGYQGNVLIYKMLKALVLSAVIALAASQGGKSN